MPLAVAPYPVAVALSAEAVFPRAARWIAGRGLAAEEVAAAWDAQERSGPAPLEPKDAVQEPEQAQTALLQGLRVWARQEL